MDAPRRPRRHALSEGETPSDEGIASSLLRRLRRKLRHAANRFRGIHRAPRGTDWVGYETLIRFIRAHDILAAEGDLVEIGTFLGGGAYKLSRFLESKGSTKLLFVVDIFDPDFDETVDPDGTTMAQLYRKALRRYGGKSQYEVFRSVTRSCQNIVVIKGDSMTVDIPAPRLCFGFIDGNHQPGYVESDFYLVWRKLAPGGAVAFHDYRWNLPATTAKIDELVARHAAEIRATHHDAKKHILFVTRR